MQKTALAIENVSHAFGGSEALKGVSLEVDAGQFCALLGLNGAGKTTLFSLITRLYDNTSGSVQVLGHDVRRKPVEALRQLGVVFQSRTLDPDLSIEQNMLYHAALHGISVKTARARMIVELERIDLLNRLKDKARALSGGQLRRVEIARALLHQPKLLLLDEPTVGLDIGSRKLIVDYVHKLAKTEGLAVLWATHLFDEVEDNDQATILHEGQVLALGTVEEIIRSNGADDLSQAFSKLTDGKAKAA